MLKPLFTCCTFITLLVCCRGYLNPDEPDAKSVTDHFVGYWWEIDIDAFGYNACFVLQEEDDTTFTRHPIFLKESANDKRDLFGTWNFYPPNTFYIYEDGEDPPLELEVYEVNECWTINWGSISEIACRCSFY